MLIHFSVVCEIAVEAAWLEAKDAREDRTPASQRNRKEGGGAEGLAELVCSRYDVHCKVPGPLLGGVACVESKTAVSNLSRTGRQTAI